MDTCELGGVVGNVANAAGGTVRTAADVHGKAPNCLNPRMDISCFSGFVFVDLQISISIDSCIHLSDHGSARDPQQGVDGLLAGMNLSSAMLPVAGKLHACHFFPGAHRTCTFTRNMQDPHERVSCRRVTRPEKTTPSADFYQDLLLGTHQYIRGGRWGGWLLPVETAVSILIRGF